MTDYEKQLAHLIKLASHQSTKAHSWHRAQELERCETGMWNGISEELRQHMAKRAEWQVEPQGRKG